ncbi:MAG: hypothetical protein JSS49_02305 [Planctomycetes bacterium]|nr:hypothetical protein [Planctomycetota bacterium]
MVSNRSPFRPFQWVRAWWASWPILVRGTALLLLLFLAINGMVARRLWHESQVRESIKAKGKLTLGKSPLPPQVAQQLNRAVKAEQLNLLSPPESLILRKPVDSDVASLAQMHTLKTLSIVEGELSSEGLHQIRNLDLVESLYLDNGQIEETGLQGLPSCGKLQKLKLIGKLVPEALKPLERCEALTELHLDAGYYEHTPDESLQKRLTGHHMAILARIPNLRTLVIRSNDFPDIDLSNLESARNLEALYVDSVSLNGDALNALGRMARLTHLTLEVSQCRPHALCNLTGFPHLKSLNLRGAAVHSEHLINLKNLPHLESLSLARTDLRDSLTPLSQMPTLKHLTLDLAELPSDGLQQLGVQPKLASISLALTELQGTPQAELQRYFPNLSQEPRLKQEQSAEFPKWEVSRNRFDWPGEGFF